MEHEGRFEFQPLVESGRCKGSLEPAGVQYTGTPWFSIHVERCGMEADKRVESLVLKPKDVRWKARKRSMKKDWNFSHRWDLVVAGAAWNPTVCCALERGGFCSCR